VERAGLDDFTLAYEDSGSGEPVVCIHGAFIADAFRPLRSERVLSSRYRLITYHRRCYVGSSPLAGTPTLEEEAEDCRSLLAYLGVERAHVVGHSFGGAVALQLSRRTAARALGELARGRVDGRRERGPVPPGARAEHRALPGSRRAGRRRRVPADAVAGVPGTPRAGAPRSARAGRDPRADLFLGGRAGRDRLTLRRSRSAEVAQPVLVVLGEKSVALHPRFGENYRLLLDWLPNAEGVVVPGATHFLQMENPPAVAEALADFYARNPFAGS
jgi:pimeloyl-ACP methyl ester carboxylesterase